MRTPNFPLPLRRVVCLWFFLGYKVLGIFKTDADAAKQIVNGMLPRRRSYFAHDPKNGTQISSATGRSSATPTLNWYMVSISRKLERVRCAMLFNGVSGVDIYNGVNL